jgi:hypothetical protein
MESCDEATDGCWADDPDGESCTDGLCEAGNCVHICSAPRSCTDGCSDIVNGRSGATFLFSQASKLCINENAYWTGTVVFNAGGTLEVCGRAAPSGVYFNARPALLNVRGTGTLEISQTPPATVDNEGLVVVRGPLHVNPDNPWTNRARIEVGEDLIVNGGGLLSLDSDSLVVVNGSFFNNGIVDGIGSACGLIQIQDTESYNNSGIIRNNADVCPLIVNSGTGPDIPECSCNPTPACGL